MHDSPVPEILGIAGDLFSIDRYIVASHYFRTNALRHKGADDRLAEMLKIKLGEVSCVSNKSVIQVSQVMVYCSTAR